MSDDDPRQIVRRYYEEVFNRRNFAAIDELIDPDFVGHSASFGTFTIAEMRRDITWDYETMPEDETVVLDQLIDGDRVVTRWQYRWKHDQPLFGETPTGTWLTMDGIHIDRIANGRIIERLEIKDFWGVTQQLGGKIVFPDQPESTC